jgi:hypothetical protein
MVRNIAVVILKRERAQAARELEDARAAHTKAVSTANRAIEDAATLVGVRTHALNELDVAIETLEATQ